MLAYALGPVSGAINGIIPIELEAVPSRDMGGYMLNMILGVICVSLSIPLGIVLALGRQSSMPLIKGVCVVFIEFIRGVPLITLLFVANVMLAYFLPPQTNFDLILRVIIMITMFSSAYIAETLVSVISMFDIVGMIRGPIQQSTDWLGVYWEVYLFASLVFFIVCYSISQYSQWLERQLNTSHH